MLEHRYGPIDSGWIFIYTGVYGDVLNAVMNDPFDSDHCDRPSEYRPKAKAIFFYYSEQISFRIM